MVQQFEGQRDDEIVEIVFRRHIIALRKGFYLLLIPFALSSIPALIFPQYLWLFLLALAGFGIGLLLFFYYWLIWFYTYFILTNQRLRQVTQSGFFGRSVVDLNLSKIQNISYTVPGFTGEVLGFGTIVIQTYVGDLLLDRIRHPSEVYNKIYNKLQDAISFADNNSGEI